MDGGTGHGTRQVGRVDSVMREKRKVGQVAGAVAQQQARLPALRLDSLSFAGGPAEDAPASGSETVHGVPAPAAASRPTRASRQVGRPLPFLGVLWCPFTRSVLFAPPCLQAESCAVQSILQRLVPILPRWCVLTLP